MFQNNQLIRSSYRDSIKTLEADIQHANTLAAAITRVYGGACLQMRLSYSRLAPIFFFLVQWMETSCTFSLPSYLGLFHILVYKVYVDGEMRISAYERRASLREFYDVIYPSLQQLESGLERLDNAKPQGQGIDKFSRKRPDDRRRLPDKDWEGEEECGICMEGCSKIVLPSCNHAMCISCYRDWNARSESCPFCRGSMKRVKSRDLWILTSSSDVVDMVTLAKENLKRLYNYIDKLPLIIPDTLFLAYYDYGI